MLNDQTVQLQTIQFRMSFVHPQFLCQSIQFKCQTVLFDPLIVPYQVLQLRAKVNLGAMAMNGYTAFSNAPVLLKTHQQIT